MHGLTRLLGLKDGGSGLRLLAVPFFPRVRIIRWIQGLGFWGSGSRYFIKALGSSR